MISEINWEQTVFAFLAPKLAQILRACSVNLLNQTMELRIRTDRPLELITLSGSQFITVGGKETCSKGTAYHCCRGDLEQTLQLISRNSLYAFEEELKMGFLTITGGHRIGLAGQAILQNGQIKALKNISSLNFRLARAIKNAANLVLPYVIIPGTGQVYNTLIISPPRCGKTTLLRDLTRQLSNGIPELSFPGVQVGLVDERSEIAACRDGIPTADLGPRIDVLDGCPKAEGLLMLIRSMGPDVVVTDELGRQNDVNALHEALHAGVKVIASVHGQNVCDINSRPYICELISHKYFDRYIILNKRPVIGSVSEIISAKTNEVLYSQEIGVKVCG
ncbi:MAG: stage sporulation protein [Firmicutes bacterium]|nr:stage sporulation protein [Bacillota bacterium]